MRMDGQVLPGSENLKNLSRDIVFIKGYREKNLKAWDEIRISYLPQYFYTPAYIFLDSKGNVLFEDLSREQMHRIFTEESLVATLRELLEKNGKGIPRRNWQKVREQMAEAERAKEEGRTEKALQILDSVIGKNAVPVLTARAERLKREIVDVKFLKQEAARLDAKKPPEEGTLEREIHDSLLEAINIGMKGSFLDAREEFSNLLNISDEEAKDAGIEEMHRRMKAQCESAFAAGRIKVTKISIEGSDERYIEVGVTVGSELPSVDSLTVQYWVLTTEGNVFAGYRTFENVPRGRRHRVAAHLPCSALEKTESRGVSRLEDFKDVRFAVYAAGEIVAARNLLEKPDSEWWTGTELKQLVIFDEPGWSWDSGTMRPAPEWGLLYGRPDVRPAGKEKK